jgi:hypothetical protein
MQGRVYTINRGINKPLEFRGLKGRFIYYGAAMSIGALVFFAILYVCGVSVWIGCPLTILLAGGGLGRVYYLSNHYGEFGLMKKRAFSKIPSTIRVHTRIIFIHLKN